MTDPVTDTTRERIARYFESELTDAESLELRGALLTNPAARAVFAAYAMQRRLVPMCASATPDAAPTPPGAAQRTPGVSPGTRRISPAIFAFSALAAALLLTAVAVSIYVFAFSTNPQSNPSSAPIATLIESTGTLTTPHDYPIEGERYRSGEYTLDAGTAEFMLTNAVSVKLRGKTRLFVHDPMHVSLEHGRTDFVCPPGTHGFAVSLPGGVRVVDLGTSFSVATDDSGRSHVTATEGRIRVESAEVGPIELVAGQSIAVDEAGLFKPVYAVTLEGLAPAPIFSYLEGDPDELVIDDELESFTLVAEVTIDSLPRQYTALLMSDGWSSDHKTHWQLNHDRVLLAIFHVDRDSSPHYQFAAPVPIGRRVHLATTRDRSTRTATLFIDGKRIETVTLDSFAPAVFGTARVARWGGVSADEPPRDLEGRMHRLDVYDAVLSDEEIHSIASSGPYDLSQHDDSASVSPDQKNR